MIDIVFGYYNNLSCNFEKDMTHNVRTTYYYFGGQRVGMRQIVSWLQAGMRE